MPKKSCCCRRRCGPGRPMKPRNITEAPLAILFGPLSGKEAGLPPLIMTTDELEALRLVDYEGLMQEEAAIRMGVSRGTVWRCLTSARIKLTTMVVEARKLMIADDLVERGNGRGTDDGVPVLKDE
ncbi:MAG: DUF134 domain-containing protein [Methanomassiliicoccus sp.]|nr:DUF134 domain-containing protein [Methanomassiliicoccus sp.]